GNGGGVVTKTEIQIASLKEIVVEHKEVLKTLDRDRESMLEELKATREQVHALALENRALAERLHHQQRHIDKWDNRIWAFIGALPTRYPHWSFGMQYQELKKGYEYGLSKIYEMVINNDPCYAYLMRCNHTVDQKLVMAHVYGHCDFFKNNAYFAHTTRKMMDEMANHGTRIRRYAEKYGEDEVETFLDRCLSIDDLIDVHSTATRPTPSGRKRKQK